MANEFKVKKGLIVDGSNTVLDIQGTAGQLFSVTDSLTGDLFSVSDVSGIPIFNVNSSGLSTFDGDASFLGNINAPGLVYNATSKYLSISHWSSPPTPAAMLHLSDNSNDLGVPQIRIEGRENPGDTVLDIAVKDADVRFNLVEGSTDASNGYGKMHFKTNANANSSNPTRGGFLFQTGAGSVIDALTITNEGNSTFAGNVTVSGTSSSFNTGNSGTFVTNDANNYPRLTMTNASAQLGLFRAGDGGMYIGGSANGFRLYTTGFAQKLLVDQSGNATFAGTVTANGTTLTGATDISGKVSKTGDTITSGTDIGLTINHDTFEKGLVLHRNHANNSPSITFKNNDGQQGVLFAQESDNNIYWRQGTNTTNYKIWHAGNDGSGSGLDADTLDGNNSSAFLQAGGSWNGANMPGSRYVGLEVNGGEVVFQRDNPNNSQMSILADGAFYAGENNGFYSLYSGNSYNSKAGFYADTNGVLQFSAAGTFAGKVNVNGTPAAENGLLNVHTASGNSSIQITSGAHYVYLVNTATEFTIGSDHGTTGTKFRLHHDAPDDTLVIDTNGNTTFAGDITQADGKRIWFRGSSASTATGGQSYIHSDGLNLKIKGDDNVKILGDGGGTIAHFDYTGNTSFNTTQTPIAVIQSKAATFSGANGVHANSRLGIMNNGSLTSIVNASTYNDPTYPDYGLVFIQGPSTSNYNVWSLSPDGPAKGSDLNFIFKANTTNIHTQAPVLKLHGSTSSATLAGNFNIDSSSAAGNTVLDVQGTAGQLFSVTNSLTGDLFSVSDVSGIPIFNVNSSGLIEIDGETTATGDITINKDAAKLILQDTGTGGALNTWVSYTDGNGTERAYVGYGSASNNIFYVVNNLGDLRFHAGGVHNSSMSSTATTFEKTAIFNGDMTLPAAADNFDIGAGSLQTTGKIRFGLPSWNNSIGLESYWMVLRTNQNEGLKLIDSAGNIYVQFNAGNNSSGAFEAHFKGKIIAGGSGSGDVYIGNDATGNFARFHTNNSNTYFDMNCGVVYWRQGSSTRFQNNMTSGTFTSSGDIIAYGAPSDVRLKENIKPIESALDKAMKLQGVTFDWKKSDSILDIKEDIGFIAQDVKEVVPELVRENEDGMLSMRHQGIAPILLEAIKELKAEIEELKKQIK